MPLLKEGCPTGLSISNNDSNKKLERTRDTRAGFSGYGQTSERVSRVRSVLTLYATQKTNPFMLAAHTHAVTLLHLIKHQNVTKHINKTVDHPATTRYPDHISWAFHGRVSPNYTVSDQIKGTRDV